MKHNFKTAIESHGDIDRQVTETYGQGNPILRVGNGGAGATGLIAALATDYLSTLPEKASIHWICNHSRNTQLALLHNFIDVGLTYERAQEDLAASEGWSTTAGCVFHDHYCLVGPASDPNGLRAVSSLEEAFTRISRTRALFHSRVDASATMWKERAVWARCGMKPWLDADVDTTSGWYKTSLASPSEALKTADVAGAYLLTDRSTLLRQTALCTINNCTVFFEPTSPDDILMNSSYALYSALMPPDKAKDVSRFVDYLFSERGQKVVASYGKAETGFPFFARVSDGFARACLRDGVPRDGKWIKLI